MGVSAPSLHRESTDSLIAAGIPDRIGSWHLNIDFVFITQVDYHLYVVMASTYGSLTTYNLVDKPFIYDV